MASPGFDFSFSYSDPEMKRAIKAMSRLQREMPRFLEIIVQRFAGTFRKNVWAAIAKNESWAAKNWRPLNPKYLRWKLKQYGSAMFWRRSGFLIQKLNPNANQIRKIASGGSGADIQLDLLEGLIPDVVYPKSRGARKYNGAPMSTRMVFFLMEYGTRKQPARPVINPAFWRTVEMADMGGHMTQLVQQTIGRL